ncbi:MAG: efflux RND transporter periplasmic adaptor subunit [Candidatus Omnitrophica bacterium]|nr:efflux RND transporter periplasmic adaptor subunit [Candidatus Omnitrophota bacterium]
MLTKKMRQNNSSNQVVREATVAYGSIENIISITGTVQPQNRLEIKPPIGGRIEKILVKEGDKVKIGQTLVWMSSTERAALLDAARAQGEESLKDWQEVYKPTPLMATIEGEVIVRAVEPGQTVTSTDAVIVLSDRLIVKAQVDETDIARVKLGQAAIISLDAYPQVKVDAKVDHVSYESTIVNNVTTYEVDIVPQRVPDVFRSGMSANVDIIEKSKDNILLIPLEALKRDKEGSFVLLGQGRGKKPVKRRVELGILGENDAEVVSGLKAKDTIIIKTQEYQPSKSSRSNSNPFMPFGRKK